jgi:hypothetical protein
MRPMHVLGALVLAGAAAMAAPVAAIADAPPAAVATSYAPAEHGRIDTSIDSSEGGNAIVIAASVLTILVVAILLVLLL